MKTQRGTGEIEPNRQILPPKNQNPVFLKSQNPPAAKGGISDGFAHAPGYPRLHPPFRPGALKWSFWLRSHSDRHANGPIVAMEPSGHAFLAFGTEGKSLVEHTF